MTKRKAPTAAPKKWCLPGDELLALSVANGTYKYVREASKTPYLQRIERILDLAVRQYLAQNAKWRAGIMVGWRNETVLIADVSGIRWEFAQIWREEAVYVSQCDIVGAEGRVE